MKLIGLFLISISLYFTWGLFNGSGAIVPESVHVQIQQSLSKEIISAIIKKNPKAYNIEVSKFWTEALNEDKVVAHFEFSFEDKGDEGASKFTKFGNALLKKTKEEEGVQFWNATEIRLEGQKIEFQKGLVFSGK